MRDLDFIGSSRKDLQEFPTQARRRAGLGLRAAQNGVVDPLAKTLKGFGSANVVELRINDEAGTFRVVYTVEIANMISVLHAFQKKSTSGIATSQRDIDLIKQRLKEARALAGESPGGATKGGKR